MQKLKKLSDIPENTFVEIVDLKVDADLAKRLVELAFIPGEKVYVVVNNKKRYVVVDSKHGRFGIPAGIAEKIYVRNNGAGENNGGKEKYNST